MSDIAIRVENLSKQYEIDSAKRGHDTLRDLLADGLKTVFSRNGAHRQRKLTERENIYLNGAILGMKKAEIDRNFDAIIPAAPTPLRRFYAYWATVNYRECYEYSRPMAYCSTMIAPPRRDLRHPQITRAAARIKAGLQENLYLGNLGAQRDWGYAKEYVEAMWPMQQQDQPDDYVIATSETHAVHEFLGEAFSYVGLDWHEVVEVDPKYFRPAEVDLLVGDASKAEQKLGGRAKTKFKDLVRLMEDADIAELKPERGK